jgi:DNA-binding SARP family transcriptional activator
MVAARLQGRRRAMSLQMVRILGPIDLLMDNGRVQVPGSFARKLLGGLVLAANHSVSLDRLAWILWKDEVPPSRNNTLQSYVHRLRHILGPDVIRSEGHSYQLSVTPDQVDALEFERLVGLADRSRDMAEECSILCKRALGLWRGDAFGEFTMEDPFRLEVLRLDEMRLFAMELQLESELAFDRPEMVIGTIEGLVEEHPYNERLWHLLVEALAMSGRRVDALRSLQELRRVLGEVGLEPSHQLLELEDRVVAGDLA